MMAPSAIIEIVKGRISLRQDSSTSLFSDEGPRYDKLMHEIISPNVHKTIARIIVQILFCPMKQIIGRIFKHFD